MRTISLGPLIVIAIIYMAIGFALSLFIKQFFWVPYRFRYGILVAGGWASSCDISGLHISYTVPFADCGAS
jgi:predicted permease